MRSRTFKFIVKDQPVIGPHRKGARNETDDICTQSTHDFQTRHRCLHSRTLRATQKRHEIVTRVEQTSDDTIACYFTEIGRFPLLSHAEEIDLAQRIEAGKATKELQEHTGDATLNETEELGTTVRLGDQARVKFVQSNLRLVVSIAKRYPGSGVALLDRIQDGNLGLLEAVDKFDWRLGFKFSTYATWWIRQAITRGIANTGRTIRLPVHAGQSVVRVQIARAMLEIKLRRSPTNVELSNELDISEKDVALYAQSAPLPRSLNEHTGHAFETELGDLIPDRKVAAQDAALIAMMPKEIAKLLTVLDAREKRILSLRFGLDNGESHTLEEIGDCMHLTRERVRQLEARALAKLRGPDSASSARALLEA